jgi:hypothetical protein
VLVLVLTKTPKARPRGREGHARGTRTLHFLTSPGRTFSVSGVGGAWPLGCARPDSIDTEEGHVDISWPLGAAC